METRQDCGLAGRGRERIAAPGDAHRARETDDPNGHLAMEGVALLSPTGFASCARTMAALTTLTPETATGLPSGQPFTTPGVACEHRILVANRGEIASRKSRTATDMGIAEAAHENEPRLAAPSCHGR